MWQLSSPQEQLQRPLLTGKLFLKGNKQGIPQDVSGLNRVVCKQPSDCRFSANQSELGYGEMEAINSFSMHQGTRVTGNFIKLYLVFLVAMSRQCGAEGTGNVSTSEVQQLATVTEGLSHIQANASYIAPCLSETVCSPQSESAIDTALNITWMVVGVVCFSAFLMLLGDAVNNVRQHYYAYSNSDGLGTSMLRGMQKTASDLKGCTAFTCNRIISAVTPSHRFRIQPDTQLQIIPLEEVRPHAPGSLLAEME